MTSNHPHEGAIYEVIPHAAGGYAVQVTIPGMHPTTVSGFASEADAAAWAAAHKDKVERQVPLRRSSFGRIR